MEWSSWKGDITDRVEAVFNTPMTPIQTKNSGRVCFFLREAGEPREKDLPYIEIVRFTDDASRRTEEISLQSTVRTLDAVHMASALLFQESTGIALAFVTSDKRQAEFINEHHLTSTRFYNVLQALA